MSMDHICSSDRGCFAALLFVYAAGLKEPLPLPLLSFGTLFKTLEDITSKLTAGVLERQGSTVKTRLDAVDMHRPSSRCNIL